MEEAISRREDRYFLLLDLLLAAIDRSLIGAIPPEELRRAAQQARQLLLEDES